MLTLQHSTWLGEKALEAELWDEGGNICVSAIEILSGHAPEGFEEQFVDDVLCLIEDMMAEGTSRIEIVRTVLRTIFGRDITDQPDSTRPVGHNYTVCAFNNNNNGDSTRTNTFSATADSTTTAPPVSTAGLSNFADELTCSSAVSGGVAASSSSTGNTLTWPAEFFSIGAYLQPMLLNWSVANVINTLDATTDAQHQQYASAADILSGEVDPLSTYGDPNYIDLLTYESPYAPQRDRGPTNPGNDVKVLRNITRTSPAKSEIIETSQHFSRARAPTPDELHGEVWDSIIHNARGICYFPFTLPGNSDGTCALVASEMTWQDTLITYDSLGRRTSALNRDETNSTGTGVVTTCYEGLGRLLSVRDQGRKYTYDRLGRVLSVHDQVRESLTTYTYDGDDELGQRTASGRVSTFPLPSHRYSVRDSMYRAVTFCDHLVRSGEIAPGDDVHIFGDGLGAVGVALSVALLSHGINVSANIAETNGREDQRYQRRHVCPTTYDFPADYWADVHYPVTKLIDIEKARGWPWCLRPTRRDQMLFSLGSRKVPQEKFGRLVGFVEHVVLRPSNEIVSDRSDFLPSWNEAIRQDFWENHRVKLSQFATQMGIKKSDCDDFIQESLIVIFRRESDYDPSKGSPWPWVFGVAKNIAHEFRRAYNKQVVRHLRAIDVYRQEHGNRIAVGIDAVSKEKLEDDGRRDAVEAFKDAVMAAHRKTKLDHKVMMVGHYAYFNPTEKTPEIAKKFGCLMKDGRPDALFVHRAKHKVKTQFGLP